MRKREPRCDLEPAGLATPVGGRKRASVLDTACMGYYGGRPARLYRLLQKVSAGSGARLHTRVYSNAASTTEIKQHV
ncbi:MAG TPA: hypothetical protein VGF67_03345 [Ktedonobacteraceae bacterium]